MGLNTKRIIRSATVFQISLVLILGIFIISCDKKKAKKTAVKGPVASELSGEVLSTTYCASCHSYVAPGQLPKEIWKKEVLPSMGYRMGIFEGSHQPDSLFEPGPGGQRVKRSKVYPPKPIIAPEDWDKIVDFYLSSAPDSIPPPVRSEKITKRLKHFEYKETSYSHRPPLSIMVKLLDEGRGVVYGDGKKNVSSLTFLDDKLDKDYNVYLKTTPVHYREKEDTIYLTTIGEKMYPHDASRGVVQKIFRNKSGGPFQAADMIISNLQRPVNAEYADYNGDGREDILVCEYGHLTGKLALYQHQGGYDYSMSIIKGIPGAIRTVSKDVNGDGHLDIYALFAQGDEGLFLFQNRGNGTFEEKRLLTFSPLNGSQYFDLMDMNGDGLDDIIYVCGDNADLSSILKDYHGIYIYLNDGQGNFEKKYFYHLNGAYKALVNDYDLDGDLDIAAISFFPNYARSPEESFVYLENKGDFKFEGYSFPEVTKGRWIVMDAEDMDADGDIDLAMGSFVDFTPEGDTTGLHRKWLQSGPSIVVLENTIK